MMKKKPLWLFGSGILFLILGGILISARSVMAERADSQPVAAPEAVYSHDYYLNAPAAPAKRPLQQNGQCAVTAVDLIGAWVDAGVPEGSFPFTSMDGDTCNGDFNTDILPLFTTEDIWFAGSQACTECHFDNSEDSRHEMDLSSYEGILTGGDVLSKPPGEPIIIPGDWDGSKLRSRLRNNRMPPGWHFDIEEGNRDGPLLSLDGGEVYAVDLIGAWVNAGAPEGAFTWEDMDGGSHEGAFTADVLPLFTEEDTWFEGSQACIECHFDNSEDSRHEMDLSSHAGILTGGDVLSKPPGEPIIIPGDWDGSKLRGRLRDNRMPPGWEFDIEEGNRDGPVIMAGKLAASDGCNIYAVDLIGAWVDAGAPEGTFDFISANDEACQGDFAQDVLPLFTTEDIWFTGSQACTECHFDNSEDSRHEMDLSSYVGILTGGDVLSKPPGEPIIIPGDWDGSKLRSRLRNNRMPPGWHFDIEEGNRDGPLLSLDGSEIYAVDLIGAWVYAGAPEGAFAWEDMDGGSHEGDFTADVLPLFTEEDTWFEGSQACIECHFDNSEDSRHEMDLSSHAGILTGGDVLSKPPGEPIVIPGDWDGSKLRGRLRDNRMPPGWEFDIEEGNRDGPLISVGILAADVTPHEGTETAGPAASVLNGECAIYAVDLIGAWVNAGAPEMDAFSFTADDGTNCSGTFETDILPLFTEEDAWFGGSQACIECHFDNSEDSRHEMDLSSFAGLMKGGDVLSEPPGVPIIIPGDWDGSKLRARLRNNRMPPGWEFDIEETNRDGPLLPHDGGDIYAVDLIGAWVDAGAPEGAFTWEDMNGGSHEGDFNTDVLPLFTEENAWFEGSQACIECHFDNSEDSRHEMDLSSFAGIMKGGDVLSEPPGVPIVVPGDWDGSKLRARLRNNRMPPGWEFDIEETNRDGPMVMAGVAGEVSGGGTAVAEPPPADTAVAETASEQAVNEGALPDVRVTETVSKAVYSPAFLGFFGVTMLILGLIVLFIAVKQLQGDKESDTATKTKDVIILIFAVTGFFMGAVALHAVITDTFTTTVTVEREVPFPVEVAPVIPSVAEVRLEDWQAKIPPEYANLTNPFAGDPEAAIAGEAEFQDHDCYECHGDNLDGQGKFSPGLNPKPVDLTDPVLMSLPFMTDNYLFWRISEGGGHPPFFSAMPAWGNTLEEDEIWHLVTYIRSQTSEMAEDEDQAAIAIVEQAGCFACHRIDAIGRGGKIGPMWDDTSVLAGERVAGMSAEDYIRQSILDPRAFAPEGYEDKVDVMPDNFSEMLSDEEVDILVNYILSLSGSGE